MREIKFRAWDKIDNVIRTVTCINWFDEYVDMDEAPSGRYTRRKLSEVILLQDTGLKDRTGRGIYEVDLLQWKGVDGTVHGTIVEVKIPDIYDSDGDVYLTSNWEIIGNIYENPELLQTH